MDYREEVSHLVVWCQDHLFRDVIKTEEMIMDYRRMRAKHVLILIDGPVVEQVESFKFFGVHITNQISCSKHTKTVVKST
jgi:histidyl-tRNA synthetase